jgi:hypothetical protein
LAAKPFSGKCGQFFDFYPIFLDFQVIFGWKQRSVGALCGGVRDADPETRLWYIRWTRLNRVLQSLKLGRNGNFIVLKVTGKGSQNGQSGC